ncbi:MAG: MFS transporter [Acidobacteriaceae bacterium]|nr:MFS transporter [Acidobacteriaceae bacterium]
MHWIALALLVLSVCINYADRGNLGVAAKSIESELHVRPDQLGILLGSFSLTYAFFQILAGKLIDHWNVNWVYAAAFFLWSSATGLTGLAPGFSAILALRLVLGASESVAYPAYSKMIVISFPEQLRGTANALIDAGSKAGPALGVLLGVKMIEWFSWRGMFFVIGAASLFWLLPWCLIAHRLPGKRKIVASGWTAPSYREIVSQRALWGTALGLFAGNYAWFLFLNWLPYYFEDERHYTKDRLALFASLPFWAVAISSMLFGVLADALIRRGYPAGRVRQTFVCAGLLGCAAFMLPAVSVSSDLLANVLLIVAFIFMGAFSSNHWAFTQMLSGPHAAGKWTGFQNCVGNFAGMAAPYISGVALQAMHSFFTAFAIASAILLFGVLGYWVVVGKPSEIIWNRPLTTPDQVTYS